MRLDTAQRNALPNSSFAGPDRSFPDEDLNHARNAKARAHFAADPSAIRARVMRDWPQLNNGGGGNRDTETHLAVLRHFGR
jgi:hypothetical protein